MGKTIDELKLDDTPIEPTESKSQPDDWRSSEAYRFITDIEDLLATGRYTWAEATLRSIQVTVEKTGRVTVGQKRAVTNIENAAESQQRSRRYEGWRRR